MPHTTPSFPTPSLLARPGLAGLIATIGLQVFAVTAATAAAPAAATTTTASLPASTRMLRDRPVRADFGAEKHSADATRLADWVVRTDDNHDQPFALIDKRNARVFVFDGKGHLRGDSAVLLGAAHGDDSAPGIGNKPLSEVKESEKTTPAGRFVGEHGDNLRGEGVIWIDYDAAVSMHPVLTTNPKEHRLERLATPDVADKRISFGCVNVPKAFFHTVVYPTLNVPHPVVYVLPETRSLQKQFAGYSDAPNGAPKVARK